MPMECQSFPTPRVAAEFAARIDRAILARHTAGMKLLDQYESACKVRRLAPRTIQTYRRWVEEFLRFHHDCVGEWIHPEKMGEPEVEAFLTHLAVNRRVAASTQNQALGAILFLYRHVLEKDLGSLDAVRASKPKRLPTVLSKEEVRRLIAAMPQKGAHRLIVELLYGTGMRISECCRLRVCDVDFDRGQIVIRESKGNKDRVTMLPQSLGEKLKAQIEFVRLLRHFRKNVACVSAPYLSRWDPHYVVWTADRKSDTQIGVLRAHKPAPHENQVTEVRGSGFGCLVIRSELIQDHIFTVPSGEAYYDPYFFHTMSGNWKRLCDWSCECEHLGPKGHGALQKK